MGHTPFGYRIENGIAVVDEEATGKLKKLYENYLSGMSLSAAAAKAGIETYHGTAKRLMQNEHYLGDDFYPAIIDAYTFNKAKAEIAKRAAALGRNNKATKEKVLTVPTRFRFLELEKQFDHPALQAEYLYSRIECEVTD